MESIVTAALVAMLAAPAFASLFYVLNRGASARIVARVSFAGAAVALLSALVLAYEVVELGSMDRVFGIVGEPTGFHFFIGAWIDRLSIISLILVTSIGLVVQRYSSRYLEGDQNQGRFFAWLSFVLFSVTLFVVSRNLLALTLAWFLMSLGVHRLLLHFPEREAAQKAAWRKFVVSRIGDVALLIALWLTYRTFGTFELKEIFAAASSPEQWNSFRFLATDWNPVSVAGALYVVGAMTKSAQFPFHIWLPDTMETPTPVSALMHAGIINAGGFLVIRLSPIVSHAIVALDVLFLLGAFTAAFGGLVYLVQSDTKRSLAYSTIAQMGYMMMQCGLGAFAAALLHLVMHGFYKANAFLSAAGNIATKPFHYARKTSEAIPLSTRLGSMVVAALVVFASTEALSVDLAKKAGGTFLCLFLWLSATQALAPVLRRGVAWRARLVITAATFGGMLIYWTLLAATTTFLVPVFETAGSDRWSVEVDKGWQYLVAGVFVALFVATEVARALPQLLWARRFYILCLNHFYIEHAWQRILGGLLGKTRFLPAFETSAIQKSSGLPKP